ncbi:MULTISPECIES: lysylphosphatidylglycerol synthase transmembrane domain-containing protein [Actinosynnema]|uniref:lysylphosphatidylglycerol synthase transmembrane domain-containing protein n=1 Tax=Actinosynnema TaxID=40566 RepID=UPI0020A365D5|nr:lysylphosphatidylglycerol synthase transmembrane domain-containing protein [Actinosynnema pretiosum]
MIITRGAEHRTTLLKFAAVAVVVVALAVFAHQVDSGILRKVFVKSDPAWVLAAIAASTLPVLGNVLSLRAASPVHLPWGLTTVAQLATSFGNLVTPANLGGMATNVRFLGRNGVPTPGAVGAVGAVQGTSVLITVMIVLPFLATSGRVSELLSPGIGWLVAVAVVVVLAAALLVRRSRVMILDALAGMGQGLGTPGRCAVVLAGHVVALLGSTAALAAAVAAFGGDVPLGDLLLVAAAGTAIAGAVPVPGGAGAAELVLAAQLAAVGLDPSMALVVALLHRLISFWARVPIGWVAFSWLRREGHL